MVLVRGDKCKQDQKLMVTGRLNIHSLWNIFVVSFEFENPTEDDHLISSVRSTTTSSQVQRVTRALPASDQDEYLIEESFEVL